MRIDVLASAVLASVGVFGLPAREAAAATTTLNVVVRAYCNSTTDVCGYPDEAAFENAARDVFTEMNMIWRPTDISFRINAFDFQYGTKYASVDDPADAEIGELKALAAANPDSLSLFVLPALSGGFSAVPAVGVTPTPANDFYGVFSCCLASTLLAHEFGHHFCLPHPHTHLDPADAGGNAPNHDGDGLADTPDDPGEPELVEQTADEKDRKAADVIVAQGGVFTPGYTALSINENRDWCDWTVQSNDSNSPFPNWCTAQCKRRKGGTTTSTSYTPRTELVLSYYKHSCSGPWVRNGVRTEAFSNDQMVRVKECLQKLPERQKLVPACQPPNVDFDGDGLCFDEDPCPLDPTGLVPDTDGDGQGDECDLCPFDPTPETNDTDQDGLGDLCDPDDDNDGCLDAVDENPLSPRDEVGVWKLCGQKTAPFLQFAGLDTDSDGLLNCQDPDNDNDGALDADDPCPNVPNGPCTFPGPCVEKVLCQGAGCKEWLDMTLISLVNPELRWQLGGFRQEADLLFFDAAPGLTISETARALAGGQFPAGWEEAGDELLLQATAADGGQVVASLGRYSAAQVEFEDISRPPVLALSIEGDRTAVRGTWGAAIRPGELPLDTDADDYPDPADNCTTVANPGQLDADRDLFGDACDADFDNDGRVTGDDLLILESCLDTSLARDLRLPDVEPGASRAADRPVGNSPVLVELVRRQRCHAMDLDGDERVDAGDLEVARGLLGQPPGPSGLTLAFTAPVPGGKTPPGLRLLYVLLLVAVLLALLLWAARRRR